MKSTQTKIINDIAVIKIRGALMGGDETVEVRNQVKNMIASGNSKIVMDFSRVHFLNSHGLGMLMASYSTIQNVQGKLVLSRIPEKVKKVMTITKIIKLFDHYDSLKTALKSFK